ncbi:MAG TPA: glycosyltransferase, partial [Terriglobales bacterium]
MSYFHWITGTILALIWLSRVVDAAIGVRSLTDISRPEWDRDPANSAGTPRVAIIVPARNEEQSIGTALSRLMVLEYANYQIIAVNDRSTDRTGEIMDEVAKCSGGPPGPPSPNQP